MTFDDELRERFRRADAGISREPLDFAATVGRAKRLRLALLGGAVAAAAAAVAVVALVADGRTPTAPRPIPPAATPPGETTPPRPPAGTGNCSAADLVVTLENPNLPEDVRHTWSRVIYAALACDYDQLEYIAGATSGNPFHYSFGESGDPGAYWKRLETGKLREPVTAALVTVLKMPWKVEHLQLDDDPEEERLYVWPRAASEEPTAADWEALIDAGLHDRGEVEQMRKARTYYGYRAAIAPDGDWVYFVAGD